MEHDVEITAGNVLSVGPATIIPDRLLGTDYVERTSAAEIVGAFRQRFARASDAGVWKRLSNAVLEPANPFDAKAHRGVRLEAAVLGPLVLAALGLAAYFNFSAPV
jgi:hypothetical protein